MSFGIADNRTHEFAEWDEPPLAKVLAQLAEEDALDGVGYTKAEVAALLRAEEEIDPEDDIAPEPPESPVSRLGDLWVSRGGIDCSAGTARAVQA